MVDGTTQIGNSCYLMTRVNVDHDCLLEDDVTIAAGATLGGSVKVVHKFFIVFMYYYI